MTNHPLIVLSDHDLIKLRDIYEKHLPFASHVYGLITTYMKWKKLKKSDNNYMTFYSLRDDWSTTGTFIMQHSSFDIFVFTLQKSCTNLYEALIQSKMLSERKRLQIYGTLNEHYPAVVKALDHEKIENYRSIEMMLYYIPKDKALDFRIECPDNVYVGKVTQSHIPMINSIWPHRFEGSERYLTIFLEMNGGYGIFLKENNKLIAWALRNHWGTLINLQTLPEYKRMGYGELIVMATSKKVAEEGLSPQATIVVGNLASETLFKKLGFEHLNTCTFVNVE